MVGSRINFLRSLRVPLGHLIFWAFHFAIGANCARVEFKDVVDISSFIRGLKVVVRHYIGPSLVDDEFELLAELYGQIHTEHKLVVFGIFASNFVLPRRLTKLAKDIHSAYIWAQVETASIKVKSCHVDTVYLRLAFQFQLSIRFLDTTCTLKKHLAEFSLISFADSSAHLEELEYFLSSLTLLNR